MKDFVPLLLSITAVLFCSCASHPQGRFVTVAFVGEAELATALVHHLEANGVPARIEGGLVYDLYVPTGGHERAIEILRDCSVQTNKYFRFR